MFCRELVLSTQSTRAGAPTPAATGLGCAHQVRIVSLAGSARVPLNPELRHSVRRLLQNGEREIVLDLAHVSTIDAAGVGQLVRAYNMTSAVNGVLRITNTRSRVRTMLERAGLFGLLAAAPGAQSAPKEPLWPRRTWVICPGRA